MKLIYGVVIGLGILGVAMCHYSTMTPEERAQLTAESDARHAQDDAERAARNCTDSTAAFVMTQQPVKSMLRAPRTARFPFITDPQVTAIPAGECTFAVRAYVDAENAFGGEVRTPYSATIRANSDGTWTLISGPDFQ